MVRRRRVTNKKKASGRKRRTRCRDEWGKEEEEDDEDYVVGEEDEESESSYESDVSTRVSSDEEESFEFIESSGGGSEEEEEIKPAVSKRGRASSAVPRNRKRKARVSDDDEEEAIPAPARKPRSGSRRRMSRDSDFEEEDDEDFLPDEDEDDEEEISPVAGKKSGSGRKAAQNKRGTKRKSKALKPKERKRRKSGATPARKRRRTVAAPSSDDDDFIVKDRATVDKQRKKSKKARRKRTASRRTKKRSSVDSESSDSDFVVSNDDLVAKDRSDSDFVISDDDFVVKDRVGINREQKKRKMARKKKKSVDSDSSDFDLVISEEEVRDLGIGGISNRPQPKRIFTGRKGEEKGKQKEADVLEKQVCGICLSEEQKGTIQGVLNCCAHYFCFACIMEWSKVESRCPVCKRRFNSISKSARSDPGFGLRKAVIRVQKRDQVYRPSEEEIRGLLDPYESVVCMVCQQGGDDSLMLLCDICDSCAHTYCVGLGREVPEGNWYCEGCRNTGDGSSNSQVQDAAVDQGTSSSDLFSGGIETEGFSTNLHASTSSRQSESFRGQSSSQRIDLNVSPRYLSEDDHGVASQVSGAGASTVSGRRAIHQHIRILLSNTRPRQTFARSDVPRRNLESDVITSEVEQGRKAFHVSEGMNPLPRVSGTMRQQQNNRPTLQSNANLAPCMFSEGSSLRHVEGAKEQVQSMVKSHLEKLSRDSSLERTTFKEIARHSTHTILAACGIEHRKSMVASPVQPPNSCSHNLDDGPANLMKGCCSSCFSSFIRDVVQKLMNTI